MRVLKLLPTAVLTLLLAWSLHSFIEAHQSKIISNKLSLSLKETITERAKQTYVAPVDARYDPVWKLIPSYEGLALDEQKTWLASKRSWQKKRKINEVYKRLKPLKSLSDFSPAPIYRGNPNKPMVAIMINVAWGNEHLPSMLQTLRKTRAKATFFLDGKWLSKNEQLARQILQEGHELSNHAYSHKNMSQLSTAEARKEIERTEALLKRLGVHNRWFAPPSGDFDEETVYIADKAQLFTVLWTIDTVDWRKPPAKQIFKKVSNQLEPGALILMHPTDSASQALPLIIAETKRRGLRAGTVSETLSATHINFIE